MVALGKRMQDGLEKVVSDAGLEWYVATDRLPCGVPVPPPAAEERGGGGVHRGRLQRRGHRQRGAHRPLDALIHLWCANRGILLTPVHEMALVGPTTTADEVDHYVSTVRDLVVELTR